MVFFFDKKKTQKDEVVNNYISTIKFSSPKIQGHPSIKTVLFVDDHKFHHLSIKAGLLETGYQVYVGFNGEEAVKLYREKKPDAVLLDLLMPVMDGFDALKEIKDFDPKAKVIMMLNLGLVDEITENIKILSIVERGAAAILPKPVTHHSIHKKLRDVFP